MNNGSLNYHSKKHKHDSAYAQSCRSGNSDRVVLDNRKVQSIVTQIRMIANAKGLRTNGQLAKDIGMGDETMRNLLVSRRMTNATLDKVKRWATNYLVSQQLKITEGVFLDETH